MFDTGKMKKKVEELKKSGLIRKNEKILIAFSGGPDSVFLYNLLNFLKEEYSLEISLIYINHNLREDVGNDLKFVREFSEENNEKFIIIKNIKNNLYIKFTFHFSILYNF